jgi:ABC-2 type transport system ATP-binding protein
MNQTDSVIEIEGLSKIFRDFWGRPKARAVNNLTLNVKRGQVFGLLGPNGSGKSTTVKLILGLLHPTRGTLNVLGKSPRNVETKRHIGYLPEETFLYKYLTATETLDFFGALFGIPERDRRQRSEQLLEMVGLTKAAKRPVGEFSKGMARRIGLAQALVNDPDLVILDEPTSGLDPIGCREVKDLIRMLASRGKTVILSSHLLADVEDICDEVVILYGGRIRAQGSLHDILKVENQTRITTPTLEPAVLEKVLQILREHTSEGDISIDRPSMNLEEFFLDVVRQARESSQETAGAQAGGEIAAYLRGTGEVAIGESTEKILASLTEAEPPTEKAPVPAKTAPAATQVKPELVESRLQNLTEAPKKAAPAPADSPSAPRQSADLLAAERKLKDLLNSNNSDMTKKD